MTRSLVLAAAVFGALSVLALAPAARAQGVPGRLHVGVSGGVGLPASSASEGRGTPLRLESSAGWNATAHLVLGLPLRTVALRGDVSVTHLPGRPYVLRTYGGTLDQQVDRRVRSVTMNVLAQVPCCGALRPYAIGGFGVYELQNHSGNGMPGTLLAYDLTERKSGPGVNGGVGAWYRLGSVSVFAEARYHYVFDDNSGASFCSDGETCIPHRHTAFLPLTLGVMF